MAQDVSGVGKTSLADLVPVEQRTTGPDMTQQDFLKIMIEQIRGQNPLDSEGGVQDYFGQMVQFQTLDAMQNMTKAIGLLAEVSSLSQSASLLGRSVVAEIPVEVGPGELPVPPELVEGEVLRVTFDDTNGAVVELESGLRVPMSRIVAVE
jgi:flagellar hook assembly protein FlgD